jgi:Mg-chelatase subunit ChlD
MQSAFSAYSTKAQAAICAASLSAPSCPTAEGQQEASSKAPVDIVVALDVSGSMEGEKLSLSLKTLEFVVDTLRQGDRLGLVTYDTEVSTLFGLTLMDDKGKASSKKVLRAIHAGSSTNLSGGLLKSMELMQTRENVEANRVSSVLLFTDGLPNVGIRDADKLATACSNMLGAEPKYTVFSFGFGADHDAVLLKSVAEAGRGMYAYIKTAEDIPESFGNCLGGLLSVVGQNLVLKITAPAGTTIGKVFTNRPQTRNADSTEVTITLSDIQADEKRDILFELNLPEDAAAACGATEVKSELRAFSLLSNAPCSATASLTVQRAQDVSSLQENEAIRAQRIRLITSESTEKALLLNRQGRNTEAEACLTDAMAQISLTAQSEYADELKRDLGDCLSELKQRRVHMMCNRQMEHSTQRSSNATSGTYTSPMKVMMKARAKKAFESGED